MDSDGPRPRMASGVGFEVGPRDEERLKTDRNRAEPILPSGCFTEANAPDSGQQVMFKEYYNDPYVRARMIEFLGGDTLGGATCVYLSRADAPAYEQMSLCPPYQLLPFLEAGLDISRSLWDTRSLLAHLDIEYVNFDFPAEPYLDLHRSFEIQQPVEEAVEKELLEYGIVPLHLISGRGHHFVWRVGKDAPAFERCAAVGRGRSAPSWDLQPELRGSRDLGEAFIGLGLAMEYLGHRIQDRAARECKIPVELTAVEVGPIERGREVVSIDLSEYGDPLHTRVIRIPFSIYRKPWEKRIPMPAEVARRIPPLMMIPLHEMDSAQAVDVMCDPQQVRQLAQRASVKISECSAETLRLIEAYERSDLRQFHDWFYAQRHEPPPRWPGTYDRTPLEALPKCVRQILQCPNDLLLKPAGLKLVALAMLALGWHPRHIAGLIRSKYERDYGWGAQWYTYDAAMRADFYTRVFAGLFAVGRDELVDFNCLSTKEKGFCFSPEGACDLEPYRESLLERRHHERLGCRPFNRLLLPEEHL